MIRGYYNKKGNDPSHFMISQYIWIYDFLKVSEPERRIS